VDCGAAGAAGGFFVWVVAGGACGSETETTASDPTKAINTVK
jgi:hypothetical protein